jgi:23S rRNA (pseudouridine1915-N3)-methyltransferase
LRLVIAAIGKLKSGAEKELCADYAGRITLLGRKVGITGLAIRETAESALATRDQRIADEQAVLWSAVAQGAVTIALDERGTSPSSADFADLVRKSADDGHAELVFLLGGPDGHSSETRALANHVIALGKMTWPHRLARVMLLEQIYRAVTIIVNHPYHRA